VYSNPLLERIVERSMGVLLNIQITFPSFSSKTVSPSVKLPPVKKPLAGVPGLIGRKFDQRYSASVQLPAGSHPEPAESSSE
jgi:hypothetical protein